MIEVITTPGTCVGLHFITPWIDWPKSYSVRYYQDNTSHGAPGVCNLARLMGCPVTTLVFHVLLAGQAVLVSRQNITRVPTQDEIMDLPRQACITV